MSKVTSVVSGRAKLEPQHMHFPTFPKFILFDIFCIDSHLSTAAILILPLEIRKFFISQETLSFVCLSTKDTDEEINISTHLEGIINSK